MSTSQLAATIVHYRQQLAAREQAAVDALAYAHAHTLKLIQPKLDALYRDMAAKQQAGEDIPLSWLYEGKRLEAIKSLITGQIDHFAALTQLTVGQLQKQGVQLGQAAAMASLDASVPAGVQWSFGIPSPAAIANMVGATQAGSPLADLFNGFGQEAADGAAKALITGVTLGDNPRTVAPLVEQALDISRQRALTIARTEMLRSYRSANLETFNANSDVVDQWIWQADLSPRTCAACIAMNGSEHDLSESMDTHVNCRCTQVPKTKSWDAILSPLGIDTSGIEDASPDIPSGADWFDQQSAEVQQQILGKAKYQAYKDGQFQLADVVGHAHDEQWGHSIYERSLADTLKAADEGAQAKQAAEEQAKKDAEEQAAKVAAQKAKKQAAAQKAAATKAAKKAAALAAKQAEEEAAKLAAAQAAQEAAASKSFTPLEGTVDEVEQYLTENSVKDWLASLSKKDRAAVVEYTGSNYRAMNNYLRKGEVSYPYPSEAALLAKIDEVQQALLKATSPTDMIVMRGYGDTLLETFKSFQPGDSFIEKGFMSTTIMQKPTFSGFRAKIRVWEGAPGAYVKEISHFPGEQEFLLPYGAELKLVETIEVNGKYTFVFDYKGIVPKEDW